MSPDETKNDAGSSSGSLSQQRFMNARSERLIAKKPRVPIAERIQQRAEPEEPPAAEPPRKRDFTTFLSRQHESSEARKRQIEIGESRPVIESHINRKSSIIASHAKRKRQSDDEPNPGSIFVPEDRLYPGCCDELAPGLNPPPEDAVVSRPGSRLPPPRERRAAFPHPPKPTGPPQAHEPFALPRETQELSLLIQGLHGSLK
jgi:hypothetical protein